MRLVERCDIAPHHCAVTLQHDCREGFIDTGCELPSIDPHIYLSVSKVKEYAAELGMVTGERYALRLEELETARAELETAQGELRETQAFQDAIDVIESKDFRARKRPGRKPKQPAAQAA